jgi:DNA-binding SARP family transcriptional activator
VLPTTAPAARLLGLLAVVHGGRPAKRSAVAERLWCDGTSAQAASNLRSVLWRLPRPHGRQLVVSDATNLRLAPGLDVDYWRAQELARRLSGRASGTSGEADGLADTEDLALLEHDLLPDWPDEWLVVDRESHRQRRLHALERCSARLRQQGEFTEALGTARAAVHAEPLRESAHRCVIEVHMVEGNHAEALRQFDSYRRLLAAELGIPPTPSIRRLVAPLLGRPTDLRRR